MIQTQLSETFNPNRSCTQRLRKNIINPPTQDDWELNRLIEPWKSFYTRFSVKKEPFIISSSHIRCMGSRIITYLSIPSFSIPWRAKWEIDFFIYCKRFLFLHYLILICIVYLLWGIRPFTFTVSAQLRYKPKQIKLESWKYMATTKVHSERNGNKSRTVWLFVVKANAIIYSVS